MFDHVTIRAVDRGASEQFYSTVLEALGIDETYRTETFSEWRDFSLTGAKAEHPATQRLHVGFVAPTRAQVDDFWKRGTAAGYTSDGEPGERPQYRTDYYGAFLLDPDGNTAEALHYDTLHHDGIVDHVWIRVADLAASQRFYETIAPYAGFWRHREYPERVHFAGKTGSFSIVAGPPTENLHIAFPSHDDAKIQRFHQAAVDAGYRSAGGPGERPATTPATTPPTCSTPTGTTSSSSTTTGTDRRPAGRVIGAAQWRSLPAPRAARRRRLTSRSQRPRHKGASAGRRAGRRRRRPRLRGAVGPARRTARKPTA